MPMATFRGTILKCAVMFEHDESGHIKGPISVTKGGKPVGGDLRNRVCQHVLTTLGFSYPPQTRLVLDPKIFRRSKNNRL